MNPAPVAVDPRWLALRAPADVRARSDGAAGLVDQLRRQLSRTARRPIALIDVGAGTGSGAAWLRPRLPVRQDWRLLDVDAGLLSLAGPVRAGWARPVVADLDGLPAVLADEPVDVLTCQALLDLLTAEQVRTMLAAAMDAGACVLLALSVTGRVTLTPSLPDDDLVNDAFNAHQRRAGRLGPDAAGHAAEVLRTRGYTVTVAETPWQLDGPRCELMDAWLRGRAEAAVEQAPQHADRIDRWLAARTASARHGEIAATVGHVDLLGLPPHR